MMRFAFTLAMIALSGMSQAHACYQRPGPKQHPQELEIKGTPYKVIFRTPSSEQRQIDDRVVALLARVALETKSNVYVNSGYRSCAHNSKVKGVSRSRHLLGDAADFSVPGYTSAQLQKIAFKVGARGAGTYCGNFSHLDLGNPRGWNWCKGR